MKTSTSSGIDRQNLTNLAVGAVLKAGFNPERETVLLDIPLHGNIGDSLITLGEIALLQQFPQATWIHAGSNRDQLGPTLTRIPAHSNVLLQGGGNLGDLWPRSQIYRLDVTERVHKTARVIWLPQSVYFEDVDGPLVARTRQVLAKHRPAVLLRDIQSMRLWNDLFDHPAILCPDLGMLAQASPDLPVVPGEVLKLFRVDKETRRASRAADLSSVEHPVDWADAPAGSLVRRRMRWLARRMLAMDAASLVRRTGLEQSAFAYLARTWVDSGIKLFGSSETIHTDRLHACILALHAGKFLVAEDNIYGKIRAVLKTWESYLNMRLITFAGPE